MNIEFIYSNQKGKLLECDMLLKSFHQIQMKIADATAQIGSLMTQFIDCTKKIYEPDQNSQASLKQMYNSLTVIQSAQTNFQTNVKKNKNYLIPWDQKVQDLKTPFLEFEKMKKKFDHYAKKLEQLRMKRNVNIAKNVVDSKSEKERLDRNEKKFLDSKMEYDKKINDNVAVIEKLLKDRYIFINPTLSDFNMTLLELYKNCFDSVSQINIKDMFSVSEIQINKEKKEENSDKKSSTDTQIKEKRRKSIQLDEDQNDNPSITQKTQEQNQQKIQLQQYSDQVQMLQQQSELLQLRLSIQQQEKQLNVQQSQIIQNQNQQILLPMSQTVLPNFNKTPPQIQNQNVQNVQMSQTVLPNFDKTHPQIQNQNVQNVKNIPIVPIVQNNNLQNQNNDWDSFFDTKPPIQQKNNIQQKNIPVVDQKLNDIDFSNFQQFDWNSLQIQNNNQNGQNQNYNYPVNNPMQQTQNIKLTESTFMYPIQTIENLQYNNPIQPIQNQNLQIYQQQQISKSHNPFDDLF